MQIQEEKVGAVTVIRPTGALTSEEADAFKSQLHRVRAATMGRLVLDVSAIPYVDSAGLESLLEINDDLAQSGQSLKLCSVNETLREVLALTDLASTFENYEDVNSAVRSFL